MRVTKIDFAATSRSSRTGMVLLTMGALIAGFAVYDDSHRSEVLAQLQDRHDRLSTAVERIRRATGISPASTALSQSTQAMQRLTAPWGKLLDALEQVQKQTDSVALLSIEPDPGRGRLRLGGEAKDLAALVEYMHLLDGQGGISGLRLLSQQIKQEDAQHPVVFQLEAQWGRAQLSAPRMEQGAQG